MDITVNKNSPVPIYYQIQEQIRENIEKEKLVPGEQLPSERDLSEQIDVSRATIRKAMRGLINEGLCTKKVGKGIYVSEEKISINLNHLSGSSKFIKKMGLDLQTKIVDEKIINENKMINSKLDNEEGKLLFLQRVRYTNKGPLMLENTYLSLKRFNGIANEDFSNSLYDILKEKYNVEPKQARCIYNVKLAAEEESKLLNVQLNSALLKKEATVYDQNNLPIEYNITYFRSDKFSFVINSQYQSE